MIAYRGHVVPKKAGKCQKKPSGRETCCRTDKPIPCGEFWWVLKCDEKKDRFFLRHVLRLELERELIAFTGPTSPRQRRRLMVDPNQRYGALFRWTQHPDSERYCTSSVEVEPYFDDFGKPNGARWDRLEFDLNGVTIGIEEAMDVYIVKIPRDIDARAIKSELHTWIDGLIENWKGTGHWVDRFLDEPKGNSAKNGRRVRQKGAGRPPSTLAWLFRLAVRRLEQRGRSLAQIKEELMRYDPNRTCVLDEAEVRRACRHVEEILRG